MGLLDISVFLGFAPDNHFDSKLKGANPYLRSLLTNGGLYLREVVHEKMRYLGKCTSSPIASVSELDNLEANILSLLKRLVPDYPYAEKPLVMIALLNHG